MRRNRLEARLCQTAVASVIDDKDCRRRAHVLEEDARFPGVGMRRLHAMRRRARRRLRVPKSALEAGLEIGPVPFGPRGFGSVAPTSVHRLAPWEADCCEMTEPAGTIQRGQEGRQFFNQLATRYRRLDVGTQLRT